MRDRNGRALVPRTYKLPWIPSDQQWQVFLDALQEESLRNRVMVLLAYEGALRSNELLPLKIGDFDELFQMVTIRAKTTMRQQSRIIGYPAYLHTMLINYMDQQRGLVEEHDPLFISESPRRLGQPLLYSEWATIVKRIAHRAGTPLFKTGTFRYLRLTHMAHAGVPLVNIGAFAGYRNARSAMPYIELKMRDELVAIGQEILYKARLYHSQDTTGE
jgi:integrase/recombinase XerD